MKNQLLIILMICIVALAMVSCASKDAAEQAPVTEISVEMSEFKFTPAKLVVAAGKEITLNLSNAGAIEHDFTILRKGSVAKTPFDKTKQAGDILFEATLGPNRSEKFTLTLPEPGEYQVICVIQGHLEAGMTASILAK